VQVLRFELMVGVVCVEAAISIRDEVRAMKRYAGLDVSVNATAIPIVDMTSQICGEPRY
jgi:hypothetical protein